MRTRNKILLSACIAIAITGCGSDDNKGNGTVNEFISLDKKANFEYGYVSVDGQKTELAYLGALITRKEVEYTGLLGVFSETKKEQVLAITSEDGEELSDKAMIVNIPTRKDGYICENIKINSTQSTVITGASVDNITAKGCKGQGNNKGKTKDISAKITQSMYLAGTSRIEIKGTTAFLKTDYATNDKLTIEGAGGLGTRAYNQIFDLIKNHPEVTRIVEGHISGSIHDDINMQTGRLIRRAGLSTHLEKGSNISSGGVDLFCSGKKRTMEEGAKIGVHSWSGDGVKNAGDLPENSPLHKNQLDYFAEMLGSSTGRAFYFYTLNAAPADEIHQMNESEIAEYHLLTE